MSNRPDNVTDEPADGTEPTQSIERLFREHNDSLLRFVAARLGSYQEAKEVAQEAYVRLLKLDSPGAVSYLRAFLFKTAANIAIDRLRTRGYRERPVSLEFFDTLPDVTTPERNVGSVQELETLDRLLEQLPVRVRRALILNRYHGMDIAAIAKDLDTTERTVRRYITQALVHCRIGLDAANGGKHVSHE